MPAHFCEGYIPRGTLQYWLVLPHGEIMDFGRNWLCYVFIVALSSCLPTNVQAFASMPLSTRTAHQQSSHNRGGRVIPPHFSAFRATRAGCLGHQAIAPPPSSVVAYLSSPFDSSEYEKEEVAKRQSEELEEMIRGRRGVVVEMVEREWQEELMKTIESEGERLCAMAYEGFQTRGKGAIFVSLLPALFLCQFVCLPCPRGRCLFCRVVCHQHEFRKCSCLESKTTF